MDSPFFRSRWTSPSHPRYYSPGATVRPVPVRKSPRVVSIPVHFVEREPDRAGSVVKIQKVFRGFLVRKSVRRIAALRKEVDAVQRRVLDSAAVEVMRRDPREKLRVSEMLMNVLFRLDSVRGVDFGVREFRKAVIRSAIALQEMIDAIAAASGSSAEPADNGCRVDTTEEAARVDDSGSGEQIDSRSAEAARVEADADEHCNSADQKMDEVEHLCGGADDCDHEMIDDGAGGEESEMCVRGDDGRGEENDQEIGAADGVIQSMSGFSGEIPPESQTDSTSNVPSLIEGFEENAFTKDNADDTDDENVEKCDFDGQKETQVSTGGEESSRRRNKELLEKMVVDSKKMMGMMAELFERNEKQTQLLGSLFQRVEQLERAFVCDKLRRKKKRHAGGSYSADCPGASPEYRKFGKK